MPLTEEERRKIYEEEKARIEAQDKIKKEKRRKGCLIPLVIVLGLFFFLIVISFVAQKAQPPSPPTAPQLPMLRLVVKETKYEYGYFSVHGIAENVGTRKAFSPTISLRVYGVDGTTILAEDIGWPAGHYLKNFEPGTKAAFRLSVSVPGEPSRVRWQIAVKNCPYEVKY